MSVDIRSCHPDELERLIPLLDEEFIFAKGRTISLRLRFPTVYCRNNLHNILICADADEIISALAIRQFDWRENGEILRGAMIGGVYTYAARRGEGWASRLLEAAAMQLREEGVDFGVLWTGQPSFYSRLGWVSADCSVLGEVEPNLSMSVPSGDVAQLPLEANTSRLEEVRQNYLNVVTLRRPDDYRQLPLPAERVDLLWRKGQGMIAYALLGTSGSTGFIYELVGDANCFPVLWREACRGRRRIFINDQVGSSSFNWFTGQTGISWKNKNLAMWLPLSARVAMPRLGQWVIPYFDRI